MAGIDRNHEYLYVVEVEKRGTTDESQILFWTSSDSSRLNPHLLSSTAAMLASLARCRVMSPAVGRRFP